MESNQKAKKIIIIGAGISGLTAAVYAAKCGFNTELYEQHNIVGGECTGWDRKGYYIDNCIHWLMGSEPGTDLYNLWETVGALGPNIQMHRDDRMYTSELNGQQLSLWADPDKTEEEMIALSPEDKKEIHKLIKSCKMAKNVAIPAKIPPELMTAKDGMKMLFTMGDTLRVFKEFQGMNVQDLMDKFKHPLIKCLISDFTPADSQGNSFAMAYGNFISGEGGIPAGGSRALAFRMKEKAESYGCKIMCGKKISKIVIEGSKAKGIVLEDGTEVEADYIIPACDFSVTFGQLLPESYREPLVEEMYKNRKAYPVYNTFQVAFAVDTAEDAIGTERIWSCPELKFTKGMHDRITIKSYNYEPSFAPAGKQIVQTLQGGTEDVFEFWKELYQDKAKYEAKKQEIAELTMQKIEERFPKYKGKLSILDAWTPMTYVRYCSAYKGFYQSFMISKYSAKKPYPSAYVKGLNNVILAGQWINLPGGLPGSEIAGKFSVQRICKKENMIYDF